MCLPSPISGFLTIMKNIKQLTFLNRLFIIHNPLTLQIMGSHPSMHLQWIKNLFNLHILAIILMIFIQLFMFDVHSKIVLTFV